VQSFAYGIVLSSTATHAYWNFLLKRSRGGSVFVGLSKVFLWMMMRPVSWGSGALTLIVVGAALVLLNYAALARAYESGELSVVYPISRAGILVFLPLFGFLAFGERLMLTGWIALVVIVLGIVVLQLPEFSRAAARSLLPKLRSQSVAFAMSAALFAAIYTVWDKNAVRELPAFVYFYAYTALVAAAYVAFLVRRHSPNAIREEWRAHRSAIVQVGVFNTITYLLVLIALRGETSSYVIALRQLSIVWGVILGRALLGESVARPKQVGVALLVGGCALVALAR
jgi:drug/metabolite transporter (DMT)-like permease